LPLEIQLTEWQFEISLRFVANFNSADLEKLLPDAMELSTIFTFLLFIALSYAQRIRFAGHYSLGPAKQYIAFSETTLWPGKTPSPQRDRLALWAGSGTDTGNLIQAIIVSMDKERVQCKGKPGQWCVFASVLQGRQRMGKQYALDSNKGVTVRYDYKSSGVTEQTVSVNGQMVSSLSLGTLMRQFTTLLLIPKASGKAKGWGTAIECQDSACQGLVNAHSSYHQNAS
jgi:hypothetical protein